MTEGSHQFIMLKPMQTGVSGYARIQTEGRGLLMQVNLRGLQCTGVLIFRYCSGGEVKQLGRALVNPKGEAGLLANVPTGRPAPERLQALLVVEDSPIPHPLMIGLCTAQSAGSLLDAKNAALSLCDKLTRMAQGNAKQTPDMRPGADSGHNGQNKCGSVPPPIADEALTEPNTGVLPESFPDKQKAVPQPNRFAGSTSADTDSAQTISEPLPNAAAKKDGQEALPVPRREESPLALPTELPPREIFLPALDPAPYIPAEIQPADIPPSTVLPLPTRTGIPADSLPVLQWPAPFEALKGYFERLMPCALFDLPGWRFVCADKKGDGLWLGFRQQDGLVRQVAYAMLGTADPEDRHPYLTRPGPDGRLYRLLVQEL